MESHCPARDLFSSIEKLIIQLEDSELSNSALNNLE